MHTVMNLFHKVWNTTQYRYIADTTQYNWDDNDLADTTRQTTDIVDFYTKDP